MQRIINPYSFKRKRKPLLLVHGLLASSTDWLLNSDGFIDATGRWHENFHGKRIAYRVLDGKRVKVGSPLGFVLSQFGYDVWLGNVRGTTYSMNHTYYNSYKGKMIFD